MSLWQQWEALQPGGTLQVAKVIAHDAGGTSVVQFPNGSTLKVLGQGVAVNAYAFVRNGEIRGEAPATVPVVLEV